MEATGFNFLPLHYNGRFSFILAKMIFFFFRWRLEDDGADLGIRSRD